MKRGRYIGWLLLMVSILVLMVPVLPHHHHNGDEICFMSDTNSSQEEHHQDDPDCEGYCITKLHFSAPSQNHSGTQLHHLPVFTLFFQEMRHLLLTPQETYDRLYCFIEPLYGTGPFRVISLRAPPAI